MAYLILTIIFLVLSIIFDILFSMSASIQENKQSTTKTSVFFFLRKAFLGASTISLFVLLFVYV